MQLQCKLIFDQKQRTTANQAALLSLLHWHLQYRASLQQKAKDNYVHIRRVNMRPRRCATTTTPTLLNVVRIPHPHAPLPPSSGLCTFLFVPSIHVALITNCRSARRTRRGKRPASTLARPLKFQLGLSAQQPLVTVTVHCTYVPLACATQPGSSSFNVSPD